MSDYSPSPTSHLLTESLSDSYFEDDDDRVFNLMFDHNMTLDEAICAKFGDNVLRPGDKNKFSTSSSTSKCTFAGVVDAKGRKRVSFAEQHRHEFATKEQTIKNKKELEEKRKKFLLRKHRFLKLLKEKRERQKQEAEAMKSRSEKEVVKRNVECKSVRSRVNKTHRENKDLRKSESQKTPTSVSAGSSTEPPQARRQDSGPYSDLRSKCLLQ